MKFWEIVRFELRYQARRPWPWILFAIVLVLTFLNARDHSLADALYDDFFANSPFAVAKTTMIGTLFWLLASAVIAGEAGARDVATGMHPLTYTAPVSKCEYLGGRFFAALAFNAFILLAVQLGILLGVYSPGVDAQVIGPFRPAAFLTAYAFISLPNAFVATALQFALALRAGRAMAAYLGSMFLVFMGFFVAGAFFWFVRRGLGTILDPVGIHFIVEDLAHQWTTTEKSWRLLELKGTLLHNRLLWTGVGLATLAIAYSRFRFAHRDESGGWTRWMKRRRQHAPTPALGATEPISVPRVEPAVGLAIETRKALAIASESFRALARSWAGLALLGFIPLVTVLVVLDQTVSFGTPLLPATAIVIRELTGSLAISAAAEPSRWVIVPLFIVFFAGELVWREREAGIGEITDAMPGSEWAPLAGKFLGLGLVLALFMAFLTAAGIAAQALRGYTDFELGLYLKILFGLQLPEYLLFAVVALVVHVVVDRKYIGHMLAIVVYGFIAALAAMMGIEHNLLVYGAGPGWSYTEMRGFGASVGPWLWFKLYWTAWALLLAVGAKLLWGRGKDRRIAVRFALARRRFTPATAWVARVAVALILALGGFIFYNTNIRNEYLSSSAIAERRAEYERRYRRYENLPRPRLSAARLHVDIDPDRRRVAIRGSYRLLNRSGVAIDSIHVSVPAGAAETRSIALDRASTLTLADEEHGYRIYTLDRPLAPNDSLQLDFDVRVARRGFSNRGADPAIVANGTAFTNQSWFPSIGYQRFREVTAPAERRERGLPPRPLLAALSDVDVGESTLHEDAGTTLETVIGTSEEEVAVAPGALRRTWREGGRRYFHYATDAPIGQEWAFFSAAYAVREERWNSSTGAGKNVAIRVLHHPEHVAHVEGVMRSVKASIENYSARFGAYPYGHLTIVEHPGAPGTGAHADPSMISHGQGFAYFQTRENDFDLPYFIMAHEMAHQWRLPYAYVEGLPFLAEGLATYFAMQVVRETRGEAQFRRLMTFMRQPYPYAPIRRGEPLLRALDPYLSRRKGPFALHALGEFIGADRVNAAIAAFFAKHSADASPVTTHDLYRELRAVTPDSLKPLLRDLFEVNAYWEFRTERVTAKQTAGGAWEVTLQVNARKRIYDSAGVETEVAMTEPVPIGVFADAGGDAGELSAPLYLRMHRIRSGDQTIAVTVPGKPVLAGIDPHHILDWEEGEDDDNIERVESGR